MGSRRILGLTMASAAVFALGACGQSRNAPGGAAARPATTAAPASASDRALAARVESRLAAKPQLSKSAIHVATRKGVVTLTGTVASKAAKQFAAEVASKIPGVRVLVNELSVGKG